jgi:hypothetical protein
MKFHSLFDNTLRPRSKITPHSEATLQLIFRQAANNKILKRALLFLRFCHLRLAEIYVTLSPQLYEVIFE